MNCKDCGCQLQYGLDYLKYEVCYQCYDKDKSVDDLYYEDETPEELYEHYVK